MKRLASTEARIKRIALGLMPAAEGDVTFDSKLIEASRHCMNRNENIPGTLLKKAIPGCAPYERISFLQYR